MRCNPWRWLWGVIPIAMLTWLACTWEQEGIETDLRSRAETALEAEGNGWGEVTLDGRDAFLTGVAPDDAQPYRAAETVRNVKGIRIVRRRTDSAPPQAVAAAPEATVEEAPLAEATPEPSPPEPEREPEPEPEVVPPATADMTPLSDAERAEWEARWAAAKDHEARWKSEGLDDRGRAADAAAKERAAAEDAARVTAEEEAARKAAEDQAAAEEAKRREADAARAAEDEQRRLADEEEARKAAAAEETKRREEEEAARVAEAEKQRLADEEEQRKTDEREQAEAEAEAQRLADEQAKAEEDAAAKRKADEEAAAAKRAEDEAAAKRQQEQDLAAARQKEAEDTKRKAEADHCQGLMRSAMAEGVINFARAKSDLTRDSYLTLDRLAGIVKVCPQARINIAGHTDSEGEVERNQGLSERRAKAVADYLTSKGVDASRLSSEGFGELRPLVPNDTPDGMRQNRRIEFSVTPAP